MATQYKTARGLEHAKIVREVKDWVKTYQLRTGKDSTVSPMFDNPKGKWLDSFETWEEAHAYFSKHRANFILKNIPFPWSK